MLRKRAVQCILVVLGVLLAVAGMRSDGLAQAKRGGTIVEALGA
ncbi:MAG TPA: hypothetical protein VMG58_11000 [Candidatus Sulfotelmatobacter sp.]|nr:hypothetical protein [Candidatus Sulfotelmatobacter sp.]